LNYPKFEVTILGCGSATPGAGRHPSAQALTHFQDVFLIDCGEGSQDRLKSFGVKWNRINQIFVSHLHGDHIFGLPGLLSTFHLNHRERKLQIFSPIGLKEPLELLLKTGGEPLSFELEWIEINHYGKKLIWENDRLEVTAVPLDHRIPTYGFIFKEKEHPRKILVDELSKYPQLNHQQLRKIKLGLDVISENGFQVKSDLVTQKILEQRSYAYWSDTRFHPEFSTYLTGITTLYHEATFLHNLKEKADLTYHSTALEAAQLAKMCEVERLLIGHYSSRYASVEDHALEAQTIFPNTFAVEEGQTIPILKKKD
jgi:ribonuclease Z